MFGRRKQARSAEEDRWSVMQGEYDGSPMIARRNESASALRKAGRHPIRIEVAVPFRQADDRRMPEQEDDDTLGRFENELAAIAGEQATLTVVITTGGMREFVLYTGDGDWIADFHRELQAILPSHDVQVIAETDPTWDVYRSFAP